VRVRVEGDRVVVPWPADRAEWLFIRGSGRQSNRHDVPADQPNGEAVTVRSSANGVALVGLELRTTVESYPREKLAASLANLVAAPPTLPDQPIIRVLRIESLATRLRVDPPVSHSPVASQKSGQRVEIRTMFDPTMAMPGSEIPVRVYAEAGASGMKIHAECLDGGAATQVLADRSGIAYLPITHPGIWCIQAHHAAVAPPGSNADIVLYSTTLTFKVTKEAEE
jgi:hypothetical protein